MAKSGVLVIDLPSRAARQTADKPAAPLRYCLGLFAEESTNLFVPFCKLGLLRKNFIGTPVSISHKMPPYCSITKLDCSTL